MAGFAAIAGWIDWRQPGGMISAAGHVAVLVVGLAAFSSAKTFQPAEEALPVEMVSESQFNEMLKGDPKAEKKAEPPKPVEPRQVAALPAPPPPPLPPVRQEPPAEPAKAEPAKVEPTKVEPPRIEPIKPVSVPPTPPRAALPTPPVPLPELRRTPPSPPEKVEAEDEEEEAEVVRPKAQPKPAPPKPATLPPPAKPAPSSADLAKLLDEEQKREEAKKAEEARKLEESRKAEERRKAEADKAAKEKLAREKAEREAREKAAREKAAREAAEAKKLNDAILARLNDTKTPPSTTGSTGEKPQQQASLGAANATGRKLSPSDRAQLIGLLTEQMSRCISYSGSAPKAYPKLTFTLGRDGGLISPVNLNSSSSEANFRPFSEAAMRAVRNCQPYRIPPRFLDSYEDWKNIQLTLITDDLQ